MGIGFVRAWELFAAILQCQQKYLQMQCVFGFAAPLDREGVFFFLKSLQYYS